MIVLSPTMSMTDRISGMLLGVALGDALGAPHEMSYNREILYTGRLEHQHRVLKRNVGYIFRPIGSVTDDFEMTIALAWSLSKSSESEDQGYDQKKAVSWYQQWAATKPPMGKNTRSLFSGIKTFSGYEGRAKKIFRLPSSQESLSSQLSSCDRPEFGSNGSLMRASVFAILSDPWKALIDDCNLTNPNTINRYCNWLYVSALHDLLRIVEVTPEYTQSLYRRIELLASRLPQIELYPAITDIFIQINEGRTRDLTVTKGWVVHGLYCAMLVLAHYGRSFTQPSQAYDYTIRLGGDTDTNGAIVGAVIGAIEGLTGFQKDDRCRENLDLVLREGSGRGIDWLSPRQVLSMTAGLEELSRRA